MDKKAISEHLIDALNKEYLPRREAARLLNLNPCYITMAQNPKSFDAMSKTAWERIEAWHNSREKISSFKIPEGEAIWQPPEKKPDATSDINPLRKTRKERKVIPTFSDPIRNNVIAQAAAEGPEEHSPENHGFDNYTSREKEILADIDKEIREIREKFKVPAVIFPEVTRLRVGLDIEINLIVNGQKILIR